MNPLAEEKLINVLHINSKGCATNLEDDEIEYKEIFNWEDSSARNKYLKEIVALSNAGGGYLIFGVNDESGEIIGLSSTANFDLKLFTDQLQKYFVPSIDISGRTYEHEGRILFIVYTDGYKEVPAVCIKDGTDLKNGTLYWRYSGKAEPIKGADFHLLLNKIKSGPTAQLVEVTKKHRKIDLMPKFQWAPGSSSSGKEYKCNFSNEGARAFVVKVIATKESNAYVNNICSQVRLIDKGGIWCVFGNYKRDYPDIERTYKFRMYFSDEEENLYYQEYSGGRGHAYPEYVKPIETTIEKMNEFEELNK
jgi:hypothetical protein